MVLSTVTDLGRFISDLPGPVQLIVFEVAVGLSLLAFCAAVRLHTTSQYRKGLSLYFSSASVSAGAAKASVKAVSPPPIPYSVPHYGHTFSFLAPRPGDFWVNLFRRHPRVTGACTILLGGLPTHVLFSPSAVQALFKARGPGRDRFNLEILEKGLGLERKEAEHFYGHGEGPDDSGITPMEQQERTNLYMIEKKYVNELTYSFTRVLGEQFGRELKDAEKEDGKVVGLNAWLQDRVFRAVTTSFMGSRIFDVFPDLREAFFKFDDSMLTLFFGLPRFIFPTAYNSRERALKGLIQWHEQMQEECKGSEPVDPDGDVAWEPVYGSRINRARQRYYAQRGLKTKARAGMDLGFLFGLNSNAIQAAAWMLMHILDPKGDTSLPGRVLEEVLRAARDDGLVDVPILMAQPLLQSILHEILRLYVDVLVSRELKEDLTLPLDEEGRHRVLLQKNSVVMAPSWLGHRDEALWTNPNCDQFYAERFLKEDPVTGQLAFSTTGTGGKFFPFGGGKTICPGRVFAKQEVLASVAMAMLAFDLEPLGFVDAAGKPCDAFPGLRKAYPGTAVMATDADMMVRLKRRRRS